MKKIALLAFLASIASTAAMAEDSYVVLSAGRANYDLKKADFDSIFSGPVSFGSTLKKSSSSFKIEGGYQFNRYFAAQLGFVDLGKARYSADFPSVATIDITTRVSGLTAAAVGTLPVGNALSLFAKAGMIYARTQVTESGVDSTNSSYFDVGRTETKPKGNFGVGANWMFNRQFGARVEIERFSKLGDETTTGNKVNVDLVSAGIFMSF